MAKIRTIEDGYEYHVEKIFQRLREIRTDERSPLGISDWLVENADLVGEIFMDDVEEYMGIPEG